MSNVNYEKYKEFLDKVITIIDEYHETCEEFNVEAKMIMASIIGSVIAFENFTDVEIHEIEERFNDAICVKQEASEIAHALADKMLDKLDELTNS